MASDYTFEATDANFQDEVVNSDTPTIVDFWATWCGPCRQIAPILDELATQHAGGIRVAKVDVDKNREVAMNYQIQSIPTLIAFRNGEVVGKMVGNQGRRGLEKFFTEAMEA